MEPHKVHFDFSHLVPNMNTNKNGYDPPNNTRIPVHVSASISPDDTLEHVEDPFEEVGYQMDHEVERVLREWDTNTQKITHNTFRLRPTPSTSTPNSPFNPRKKRFSNSTSNLSASGDFASTRRNFDFPEINISKREDSRLDTSVESLTEEIKSPLYTVCPKTGTKLLKMEFDTEGYGPDNFTVKVAEQKLVIHALQNETIGGRTSTTEFCRKIKLPVDVNSRMLQCYFNPDNNTLIAEVPVLSKPVLSSSLSSLPGSVSSPAPSHSPARQQLINIPFVRQEVFGKSMHLNAEVGRVFKPDDVTVKVKGQDKIIVSADRVENTESSKLNASIYREFDLPDKIIPKTLKAALSGDGILKVNALLDEPLPQNGGHIHVKLEENGFDRNNQENQPRDLNTKVKL